MATIDVSPGPGHRRRGPRHAARDDDEELPRQRRAPSPVETPPAHIGRPPRPDGPWWRDSRVVAVLTWLAGAAIAVMVVRVAKADPVAARGALLPVTLGALAFVAILVYLLRRGARFAESAFGVLVGGYAAWVALVTKAALHGTRMGYGGLHDGAGRLAAAATRYTSSWGSADAYLPNLPAADPPLYPWLTGRVAHVIGVPAWQLQQNAEVLWLSGVVVIAFILWRRLVSAPVAAVVALLAFVAGSSPVSPHAALALAAAVPWALATFGDPPRGRLHWLPGGLVGGLIMLTYPAHLAPLLPGIVLIAWWSWRSTTDRRAYLAHVAGVVVTALALASWYLVPYLLAVVGAGLPAGTVLDQPAPPGDPPLPFLELSPIGVLQLVGVVGLVLGAGRSWWARAFAALAAGVYVWYLLALLRFVLTGQASLGDDVSGVLTAVLVAAGVFTVVDAFGLLARNRLLAAGRRVAAVLAVALLVWTSVGLWRAWMPTPVAGPNPRVAPAAARPADLAQAEPLPDLTRSRFAPTVADPDAVPITRIQQEVSGRRGQAFVPVCLSADERLFAVLPWYRYLAIDATTASPLSRSPERTGEVLRLAAEKDPARFADLAAGTAFGPIDVFVLRRGSAARANDLRWRPDVVFSAAQFTPKLFDRVDLDNGYVLFVRRA